MSLTPANQPSTPWWLESQTVLVARLQSGAGGLSEAQAAETLKRVGPNELRSRRRSLLARLGARLRNPLVLLLIAASAVSAVTGDVASFLVILVVVLMSIMLDFVQETRAANAAERLRRSVALRSRVMRGGTRSEVAATGLVPGDIVLLAAGDLVPADGLLLEARDCFVNQALLTGEPYPVEKNAEEPAVAAGDFATAANAMFMGTSLISGSARVLIVRTGAATVLGDIADTLAQRPPPNALETGSHRFGLLIMRLTVFLVLFVLLANALLHRPWLESFLFAVALAVGLTPELLPMIISVTLARGALRMAQKKVIVKRLGAIRDLGQMDVLCTDKTGTLTEARIRLERHVDSYGHDSERVLQLAYLNSYFETGLRSALDDAILQHGEIDVFPRSRFHSTTWIRKRRNSRGLGISALFGTSCLRRDR